jgi:hypothetical protein
MSIIGSLRIITRNITTIITRNITTIILTELFIYLIFLLQATLVPLNLLNNFIIELRYIQ